MANAENSRSDTPPASTAGLAASQAADGGLRVEISGRWIRGERPIHGDDLLGALDSDPAPRLVQVAAVGLEDWDSSLLSYLLRLRWAADRAGVAADFDQLPAGLRRLMALASAVPDRSGARQGDEPPGLLANVGLWTQSKIGAFHDACRFLGLVTLALLAFLRGRAVYRRQDLIGTIQEVGAQALPIVSTISILIGLILAFIGAVQLAQFGAAIYVADLVGLAMTREMAAVMTAIVVAGRTGAAFAAQLGAMRGNEEIDALATMGIPPVEFLVLPRLLALALMMPLLYVYGCFIGLFGGYLVGVGLLDLVGQAYIERTREAVGLTDFMIGFGKSAVFGVVIAFAGCQRGMEAGRSAAAVGQATTSAVVTSIVYIIVIDAVFAVSLDLLGI